MVDNDSTPGISGDNPPRYPALRCSTKRSRRIWPRLTPCRPRCAVTAWILAELVQRLTPAGVLQVLGFAHLVARDGG